MEEKKKVIEENLMLLNQTNCLKFELEKMEKEKSKNYDIKLFNKKEFEFGESINVNSTKIINNLKLKIEELEDLVSQQSFIMDPHRISELESIIEEDNKEIAKKNNQVEILNSKIKEILNKPNFIFDEKQAVYSLSQAMREKDVLILDLKKALRDIKEKYKLKVNREENFERSYSKYDQSKKNYNKQSFNINLN